MCPDDKLDHPVVSVAWDDAMAYAKWAGCGLPTEAQWEKAARGPKNLIYPWGNDWDAGKCRNSTNKGAGQTCPVWEYPAGVSGYGTLNQSGNVLEWCKDCYGDYVTAGVQKNPEGAAIGSRRVHRGGRWDGGGPSRFRGSDRSFLVSAFRDDYLGFRLLRSLAVASSEGGRMA
jgi:formylglycine-generating enzyme required for sulfatase activity